MAGDAPPLKPVVAPNPYCFLQGKVPSPLKEAILPPGRDKGGDFRDTAPNSVIPELCGVFFFF